MSRHARHGQRIRGRRGATLLAAAGWCAALGLAAVLKTALAGARDYRPGFGATEIAQEAANSSAFAQVMGEIRATTADLIWVKTERYLHRGVAYSAHISAEELAQTGAVEAGSAPTGEGGRYETLIPADARDYRGFIGRLHRSIQPWEGPDQPHEHTGAAEIVPWYRLLTLSNPRHWRGYMIGAWTIGRTEEGTAAVEQALAFIEEGIRNNPDVFQLHLMRARLLIQREEWEQAIATCERAVELALKVRPAGGVERLPLWSESDEEDFAAALRYVPLLRLRKLGDAAGAREALARALTFCPADTPLNNLKAHLEATTEH